MARRYTNHDHYCEKCGKRIKDGEDYWRCGRNLDFCEDCADDMCAWCEKCKSKREKDNGNN